MMLERPSRDRYPTLTRILRMGTTGNTATAELAAALDEIDRLRDQLADLELAHGPDDPRPAT